jgi:hypothetical protein
LLALHADVLEVAGVPQGVEVAFQRGLIVNISWAGKDTGPNRICGNAAVAVDFNCCDDVLLGSQVWADVGGR